MHSNLVTGRVIIVNNVLFDANLRRILMLMMQYAANNTTDRMVADPSGTERVAFSMAKMLACYEGSSFEDEKVRLQELCEVGEAGRFDRVVVDECNHWAFREVEKHTAQDIDDHGCLVTSTEMGFFELTFVGCNRSACRAMTSFLGTFGNFIDWEQSSILSIQEKSDHVTLAVYDDVTPYVALPFTEKDFESKLKDYLIWIGK